jgi:single-strand DNA-binding protein
MNKVFLIGNVGSEPDVHTFDDGSAVANISLATTERGYKLQNGTEVPDRTDWHRIVLKGNTAKAAEKYVHKGDRLCVVGKLTYREYEDRNGQKVRLTEIIAHEMEMLTPKSAQQPAQQQQPVQAQPQTAAPQPRNTANVANDLFLGTPGMQESDLPF